MPKAVFLDPAPFRLVLFPDDTPGILPDAGKDCSTFANSHDFRPMARFLVIDHNMDGRALLARTLRRKFPSSEVVECGGADEGTTALQSGGFDAVVVHRTEEVDGETLVKLLRRVNSTVPLIAVSGFDRSEKMVAAGATEFLNYDQWLTLGTVVARHLPKPKP